MIAKHNLPRSRRTIAQRLVTLYTTAPTSTLEVILGATNLDDVLDADRHRRPGLVARRAGREPGGARSRPRSSDARSAARGRAARRCAGWSRSGRRSSRRSRPAARRAAALLSSLNGEVQRLIAEQQARELARRAGARRRALRRPRRRRRRSSSRRRSGRPPRRLRARRSCRRRATRASSGVALSYLGTPYVWAGSSPGGFDCSGLVMYAYSQMGVSLPHSSYAMWSDGVVGADGPARARRPRLLRRPRPRRALHRRRRVRPRARTRATSCRSRASTAARTRSSYVGARRVSDARRTSAQERRPGARIQGSPSLDFSCSCARPGTDRSASASSTSPSASRRRRRRPRASRTSQFKLLHRECLTPIQQKRWCPVHDVEVGPDEIVRGWEVAKGQFVPIEDAELEAIEQRDTSRAIEIRQLRARRRGRPGLLRPHLLPRAGGDRGAAPAVRAAARGDARVRRRRARARSCSPARRSSA